MAPLIALVLVTSLLWLAGRLGARVLRPWPVAVRGGLAVMFTLTGMAHFVGLREDLIAMVPPFLPAPGLLVTVTGVLELAGVAGLLVPATARWAAAGLSVLLVVMFPANVYQALYGVTDAFDTALLPRTLMQVVFLAATLSVVFAHRGAAARLDPAPVMR